MNSSAAPELTNRIKKIANLLLALAFITLIVASYSWIKYSNGADQSTPKDNISTDLQSNTKNFLYSFFKVKPRNYISVVGSSTVYPFTAVIAEKFARRYEEFRTPTIEATGTGGGFKLFCGGVGYKFPDFVNASREVKASELVNCKENGVTDIIEIKIGYDGIVLANSNEAKPISISKYQLFLALAQKVPLKGQLVDNFYKKWSDISPKLPDHEIRIYGPPPSSGTRDALVELAMEKVCAHNATFINSIPDKKTREKKCQIIRSDGHFIEAGENDNLILQKLNNDAEAFGIFGFSFLNENRSKIQASTIDYVLPTLETIKSQKYKISRPLFIYYKPQHLDLVAGSRKFVQAIISPDALGDDGFLVRKGLIPLSDFELRRMRDEILRDL